MTLSDKFNELKNPGRTGSDYKSLGVPEDWRPRMDIDNNKGGFLVSSPQKAGSEADADAVLKDFGLDPEQWSVTSIRQGKWQRWDGEFLESLRVNVVPAAGAYAEQADTEQIIKDLNKWRPSKGIKKSTGEGAFLIAPSDQQLGKRANGEGSAQSVNRILGLTDRAVEKFNSLKKAGIAPGTAVLALPGDHVEGNVSQNGRLQGQAASDMGLTEQVRVARRLLMTQIKALAPLVERLIIPVINGNHDEVTRQVAADPADGWNTEIASAVQDACAENPELSHVEFRFPSSGHQTLTVDIDGCMLGLFHGHQASQNNVMKFLSGHAAGQTALGMADVWISGHYHNFRTMDVGSRLWIQAPTTDPGSEWFRDRSGMESNPGLLSMVIGGSFDPRENISVLGVK